MVANPITAWSYSRLSMYEECPAKFKYKNIDKLPDPPGPAMARGDAIHKAVAKYLNGSNDNIPPEAEKNFGKLMRELREMPKDAKVIEQQWAFSSNWKSVGYFDKQTWLRVILDAGVVYPDNTADVVDHKTGKKYGTNVDQMALFAVATVCRYPAVKHVTTRLWYLDIDDPKKNEDVEEFTASDVEKLKAKFEQRVSHMFGDQTFAARPNEKCHFCPFNKSKGGPCRFG